MSPGVATAMGCFKKKRRRSSIKRYYIANECECSARLGAGLGGVVDMACEAAHVPPGINQKWVFCLQGPAKLQLQIGKHL